MNVLVIAPHPDDEAIGCGGTLLLHAGRGDAVTVIFLTSGELGLKHLPVDEARSIRENEAASAAKILKIASLKFLRLPDWYVSENTDDASAKIVPIVEAGRPNIIYTPHVAEAHRDHSAALPIMRDVLKKTGVTPELRCYEVWTPLAEFQKVEDITATVHGKLQAIRCYRSQLNDFHYDRSARGLGQYRGALAAKCRYAEVFELSVINVH